MNTRIVRSVLLGLSVLAAPALGQVSPGDSIVLLKDAPGAGLEILDVAGGSSLLPVSGVPAQMPGFGAGVLDPVTGDIWAAGSYPNDPWSIYRISLSGSAVASFSLVADLSGQPMGPGAHGGIIDMALDRDGNLFVAELHNVWRLDRSNHAVTPWVTNVPGNLSAIAIDPVTNVIWTAEWDFVFIGFITVPLVAYDIDAGPGVAPLYAGAAPPVEGLTIGDDGTLYGGSANGLWSKSSPTSSLLVVPGSDDAGGGFRSLDFDSAKQSLHTGGGLGNVAGYYGVMDLAAGAGTIVNDQHACASLFCVDGDEIASVGVHDMQYTTQIYPKQASRSAGLTLEASANGMAGDLGIIAVTEINGIALGEPVYLGPLGFCDTGGRVLNSSTFGPGSLPIWLDSVGVQTATFNFTSGAFVLGGVQTLNLLP